MLAAVLGLAFQLQLSSTAPSADLVSWRFRAGDDASWSQPGAADADWDSVRVPHVWPTARAGTFGWYRLHFTLAGAPDEPVGVWFRSVIGAFEVYVDGVRIGGSGAFPPHYRGRAGIPVVAALPAAAMRPGPHVNAVRVYSAESRGGFGGGATLGPFATIRDDSRWPDVWFLAAALLLIGIGLHQIFFFLRRPLAREHLWIFVMCVALALFFVWWMPTIRVALEPSVYYRRLLLACAAAAAAAYVLAFRRLFDLDDSRILPALVAAYALMIPPTFLLPDWGQLSALSSYVMNPLFLAGSVVTLVLAVQQLRAGSSYAQVLLWGTALLAVTLVYVILVDLDVLHAGSVQWATMVGSVGFVGSMALSTAEKFVDSETASLYDRLTGLYRREVVMDALSREIRRSARTAEPIAVLMLDLDKFKQINDTLGHQAGDKVLTEVGRRLAEAGRAVDWLGRYGGEEFLAICASTDLAHARQAAERLRRAVSALPIATGRTARTITLSVGVAAYAGGEEWPTVEQLVGAADAALYRAKNAGRDCVME